MVQIEAYRLKERLTSVEDGGCREQAWQSPTSLPAMVVEGVAGSWNKAMWSQCLSRVKVMWWLTSRSGLRGGAAWRRRLNISRGSWCSDVAGGDTCSGLRLRNQILTPYLITSRSQATQIPNLLQPTKLLMKVRQSSEEVFVNDECYSAWVLSSCSSDRVSAKSTSSFSRRLTQWLDPRFKYVCVLTQCPDTITIGRCIRIVLNGTLAAEPLPQVEGFRLNVSSVQIEAIRDHTFLKLNPEHHMGNAWTRLVHHRSLCSIL
ncbi:hypothetical protein AHAS_Ahas08G0031600 [Arachis hypogaea]